jgi:hypothetical protein
VLRAIREIAPADMRADLFLVLACVQVNLGKISLGDSALGLFVVGNAVTQHEKKLIVGRSALLFGDKNKLAQHVLGHVQGEFALIFLCHAMPPYLVVGTITVPML